LVVEGSEILIRIEGGSARFAGSVVPEERKRCAPVFSVPRG
jgi:hypothetical protein